LSGDTEQGEPRGGKDRVADDHSEDAPQHDRFLRQPKPRFSRRSAGNLAESQSGQPCRPRSIVQRPPGPSPEPPDADTPSAGLPTRPVLTGPGSASLKEMVSSSS